MAYSTTKSVKMVGGNSGASPFCMPNPGCLFIEDVIMKKIPLTQGTFVLVDDEDYDYLMQWKWYQNSDGYAFRGGGNTPNTKMHRVLTNAKKGQEVDHKDRNRRNNQKNNLRVATREENNFNSCGHANTSSKYKGVFRDLAVKKWRAGITFEGNRLYIGRFSKEVDAAKAYDKEAGRLFGGFAYLNFPDSV